MQISNENSVVWFRRDFRVNNNPALNHAIAQGGTVTAIYIDDNGQNDWRPGAASRWWCHQSLQKLSAELQEMGIALHYFTGNSAGVLEQVMRETTSSLLCWNRLYEPHELKLEQSVIDTIQSYDFKAFDTGLLFTPGTILNQQEQPYKVFTPFWKKARHELELTGVQLCKKRKYTGPADQIKKLKAECSLSDLGLLDDFPWFEKLNQYWSPGEKAALKQLKSFFRNRVSEYDTARDIPSQKGTSRLSAHLHFGEITPAQIVNHLFRVSAEQGSDLSTERYLTELGWRDFAHHILWHFPESSHKEMNTKFQNFWPKKANRKLLDAWQTGNTGIALVDAGMRELWETGWMHNRVRMIVGSFLTKNLGQHWLYGAKWFWDTLVDASLANNSMGWQWVAGCGVDAAPYFRIFNPDTQAKRFDEKLTYINHWLNDQDRLATAPIVDLKQSREQALSKYNKIK